MSGLRGGSVLALAILAVSVGSTSAVERKPDALRVAGAWIRATPDGATTAAAYLTIINRGPQPDRLLGGTAPGVDSIAPHAMSMRGGVMRMRVLVDGVEIPAGRSVSLSPGGDHLMLTGLKTGLKAGRHLDIRLKFAKAGSMEVSFPVMTAAPAPDGAMAGMKMP